MNVCNTFSSQNQYIILYYTPLYILPLLYGMANIKTTSIVWIWDYSYDIGTSIITSACDNLCKWDKQYNGRDVTKLHDILIMCLKFLALHSFVLTLYDCACSIPNVIFLYPSFITSRSYHSSIAIQIKQLSWLLLFVIIGWIYISISPCISPYKFHVILYTLMQESLAHTLSIKYYRRTQLPPGSFKWTIYILPISLSLSKSHFIPYTLPNFLL